MIALCLRHLPAWDSSRGRRLVKRSSLRMEGFSPRSQAAARGGVASPQSPPLPRRPDQARGRESARIGDPETLGRSRVALPKPVGTDARSTIVHLSAWKFNGPNGLVARGGRARGGAWRRPRGSRPGTRHAPPASTRSTVATMGSSASRRTSRHVFHVGMDPAQPGPSGCRSIRR